MNTYFVALCLLFSFTALGRDLSSCRNSTLHKGHSIPFGVGKKFVKERRFVIGKLSFI
ncbi:MAG: hypothetical protein ACO2ZP_03380 [Bacteriovoracaceae bacterium]